MPYPWCVLIRCARLLWCFWWCHIRIGHHSTATASKKREIRISVYIFSDPWEISFRAPLVCWTSKFCAKNGWRHVPGKCPWEERPRRIRGKGQLFYRAVEAYRGWRRQWIHLQGLLFPPPPLRGIQVSSILWIRTSYNYSLYVKRCYRVCIIINQLGSVSYLTLACANVQEICVKASLLSKISSRFSINKNIINKRPSLKGRWHTLWKT